MTHSEVMEKLTEIFRDVFDDEEMTISEATTGEDVEDWDSLSHITLISSIESELGISFQMDEVMTTKNVGELAAVIERSL